MAAVMPADDPRLAAVMTAFLRWADQQRDMHPVVEYFLDDPTAVVGDTAVTAADLKAAVVLLHHRGLVTDPPGLGGRLTRVQLSHAGRDCLLEHRGSVDAWRAAQAPSAGVTVHAAGAVQAVSASQHVTQIMGHAPDGSAIVDPVKAARAARAVLEELDDHHDPDDPNSPGDPAVAELRAAAQDIQAETAKDDPDQSTLQRAAGVIGRNIGAIATSAAGGTAARYITTLLGIN